MTDGPRIANAPCSWGLIGRDGIEVGYQRMLDELVAAGYRGTELGDWGFMPTDPARLEAELDARDLTLLGGFVAVDLGDEAAVAHEADAVLRVARNLAYAGRTERPPYLILADRDGLLPWRACHGGRIASEDETEPHELARIGERVTALARLVRGETGLRTAFHPHVAGRIETPNEIAGLLAASDPTVVDLVFDTAHYVYGTGRSDDRGVLALDGLERFWDRIGTVHLKDCSAEVAARARREGWSYEDAVRAGLYCELGRGSIDMALLLRRLIERGYDDWLTVEQDVFPGQGTPFDSALRNHRAVLAWWEEARRAAPPGSGA